MTKENQIKKTSWIIIILAIALVIFHSMIYLIEEFTILPFSIATGLTGLVLIGFLLVRLFTVVKSKNKRLLLPLIIGIVSILIGVYNPIEYIIEKCKSPVVFFGYCEHTITQLSLKLRKDHSFEYNNGAVLKREMYYGNYQKNADTIILNFDDRKPDKSQIKLLVLPNGLEEMTDTSTHRHGFKAVLNKLPK